jgi:hypothetical protein
MQYALLIYRRPDDFDGLSEQEQTEADQQYWKLRTEPGVTDGAGLQVPETATTLRMENGKRLVTDGPFADTKEFFAGYYVLEAPDLDAALEVAGRIPAVRLGGAIEIRPVIGQS